MKLLKVGAAVLNQTPLAWEDNRRHILEALSLARHQHVSLLCLPELCITGYGCEDMFHAPGVLETAWEMLQSLLPHTQDLVVSLGLPLVYQDGIYNTAALVANGRILGFVAKKYLAGDGIHYEPRWFKPWPAGVCAELEVGGERYPVGDLLFDLSGVRVGFEICEDAWVAKRPGGELASRGIDVILNPSASHFAFGKHAVRQRFVLEGSRAFNVSYVYANLLGNEAGRVIYDGGALIASAGQLLAAGPRLSFTDAHVTSAVIDLEVTRLSRWRSASFKPALEHAEEDLVRAIFDFPHLGWDHAAALDRAGAIAPDDGTPAQDPGLAVAHEAAWEKSAHLKEEEFLRAEALALYDYLRKSRSRGFVLSLSGGADSGAIATLVYMMSVLGMRELGAKPYLAKLAYDKRLEGLDDPKAITRELLACVYQSTRNSGPVTLGAAKGLAEAIGAEFTHFDVDALVEGYKGLLEGSLGRPLSWQTDDVALQNIQARVRAPGVWMLANVRGALLVTTSNRSEAAVGYATMDGDTAGGLAPVAGIDKAYLRRWLEWMETEGPQGFAPLPVLGLITKQAPTAELRPAEQHQTDESDLMPYEVLDAIERAAIRDKKMPLEAFFLMRALFAGRYSDDQLGLWVTRFYRLWSINQWKRERYAPSFHLDDENLDPKTWCRFPILSGGFGLELAKLAAHLDTLKAGAT
ncbi:MAG TPA: NAD(+) synthase [Oscillatoriaceae cyanobacterium]